MFSVRIILSVVLVTVCAAKRKFPPGFKFGAATSAYQVEGGWNASDKSLSIWDTFSHTRSEKILDRSNADVACDSYNLWETDVALAKALGIQFYRFSISWSRLLPNGFSNYVSKDGYRYYNDLINGLLKNGIEPTVTLYHWDLPQKLQDLGGWLNSDISIWFEEYARVAFELFGERVKTWITINEAVLICDIAYNTGDLAPGIYSPGIGSYICSKNIMMAHARAYRLYDEEFRQKFNGKVGLTNNHIWIQAASSDDEEYAELSRNMFSIYAHPIFAKDGGWPPSIEQFVAKKSKKEGYKKSRLPAFTREEIEFIKGTYDFYGLNYYTARLASPIPPNMSVEMPGWLDGNLELGLVYKPDPKWKEGYAWLVSYPPGLRKQINWLVKQYGDMEIRIFENGYSTPDSVDVDSNRIDYLEDHLEQVLLSIHEDGHNVTAFTAWALMDNYEWSSGFKSRFGLAAVDFTDPKRKRTPRASFAFYAAVIASHSLDFY